MDVQVAAPDLRGTVLILDLKLAIDPGSRALVLRGRVEIQPCYPAEEESHERTGI